MLALFGSKRKELIKPLQDKLRQKITDAPFLTTHEKEFQVINGANIITRTIVEGVPFVGLEQESDIYVKAVLLFSEIDQWFEPTHFDDWEMAAFDDFGEEYSGQLLPQSRIYLRYFQEGRPLFGKISSNEGRYYGFLTKEEVSCLLNDLGEFQEQNTELTKTPFSEFVDAWIDALDEISIAGKDLWFWAE
jgi:hypothetical protein